MKYKGYEGIVNFDEDAGKFCGEVINTRDVITFHGTSVKELQQAFRDSVDDYLSSARSVAKSLKSRSQAVSLYLSSPV